MEAAHQQTLDTSVALTAFDAALPEVYGYLFHRCHDRATAEDLTSETFLAAVHELKHGGERSVITTPWLIGVARHKLVDHWRRRERDERRLASVGVEREADTSLSAVDPGRGMEVLAGLNPMQTAALTLRHVDGLSVPEVAAALGRSVHATETLLSRARAIFRTRYLAPTKAHDD